MSPSGWRVALWLFAGSLVVYLTLAYVRPF